MDALANEVIDFVHESDALKDKVVKPLKRKVFPYIIAFGASQIVTLALVIFIATRMCRQKIMSA